MALYGGTKGQGRSNYQIPVEEDGRPHGSLLFADPSMAQIPQRIKTFNEPYNTNNAVGEQTGIASMTGRLVRWEDRQMNTVGDGAWAARNRKRYTEETEDE